MNNTCKQSIRFRDANKNSWCVEIEIRNKECERINRLTLKPFTQLYEISVCGQGGRSCGQCNDHINPRTAGQRALLDFWSKYHLNGMSGGTHKQTRYLHSKQYEDDYYHFLELYTRIHNDDRKDFNTVHRCILDNGFDIDNSAWKQVQSAIKKMNGNPVRYIMGAGKYDAKHDSKDYYVQCFFLALHGIYEDRGYKYGSSWLYDPLPDNIFEIVQNLCETIKIEEEEYTNSLSPEFNMGDEKFEPNSDIIEQVMELRECEEYEAIIFIALGMHLKCTYGDLNDTFQAIEEDARLYSANGIEYHIGTYEELENLADDIVHNDSEYEEFWREAVASKSTTSSLKDWLDSIISEDGWASVLNHWDGKYSSYQIDGQKICICRT